MHKLNEALEKAKKEARKRAKRAEGVEVGDEDEMRTLWQTFRKCFPNEKMAIEAAEKNLAMAGPIKVEEEAAAEVQ